MATTFAVRPRGADLAMTLAARKREMVSAARGRVLEIGAADLALPAWRAAHDVSSLVVLVDDPLSATRLRARADALGVAAEVRAARPRDLEEGERFDTVLMTMSIASANAPWPDMGALRRALVGQLRFLDWCQAPGWPGSTQRIASRLVGKRLAMLPRHDVLAALRHAGFVATAVERFPMVADVVKVRCLVEGTAMVRGGFTS